MTAAFHIIKKDISKDLIGKQLKKARIKKEISFEQVEEATKIRIKYLKALEEEDWGAFLSPAYIPGFLKSYAKYLGLPADPLLMQYKRERGLDEALGNKLLPPKKMVKYPKIFITSTTLAFILLGIIVLGVLGYIGYQVSGFASAPYLLIKSPNYGATVSADTVSVEGTTSPGASLYINGQLLPIDVAGGFKQNVRLKEGSNNIAISSLNRAGKKTEKELVVIFKPERD